MNSALLIISCDKYSHIWSAFFKCFWKFYPDCRFPIYLGSNTKSFQQENVTVLFSGEDKDWSSSFISILKQIPEDKLFVITDDSFINSEISDSLMHSIFNFMHSENANHIQYWPFIKSNQFSQNPLFYVNEKGAPYRACVCGFWDKKYLLKLLLPGENPWNFEILGSYRTSYDNGFYSLKNHLFSYKNMIEKGCWFPDAVSWAREQGLDIGENERPVSAQTKNGVSRLQFIVFAIVLKIPWRFRLKAMNFLRKLLICY